MAPWDVGWMLGAQYMPHAAKCPIRAACCARVFPLHARWAARRLAFLANSAFHRLFRAAARGAETPEI